MRSRDFGGLRLDALPALYVHAPFGLGQNVASSQARCCPAAWDLGLPRWLGEVGARGDVFALFSFCSLRSAADGCSTTRSYLRAGTSPLAGRRLPPLGHFSVRGMVPTAIPVPSSARRPKAEAGFAGRERSKRKTDHVTETLAGAWHRQLTTPPSRRGLVGEPGVPPRFTERAGFEPATHLAARTRFPVALLRPLGHLSKRAKPSRYSVPPRRGGRAVECGGLENRYGPLGPSRVQIPPPPL